MIELGLRSNGHNFEDDVVQCELREIEINNFIMETNYIDFIDMRCGLMYH